VQLNFPAKNLLQYSGKGLLHAYILHIIFESLFFLLCHLNILASMLYRFS